MTTEQPHLDWFHAWLESSEGQDCTMAFPAMDEETRRFALEKLQTAFLAGVRWGESPFGPRCRDCGVKPGFSHAEECVAVVQDAGDATRQ